MRYSGGAPVVTIPKVTLPKPGGNKGGGKSGGGSKHVSDGGGSKPKLPDWMAPMTKEQIIQQARNTINKAYASSFQELGQERHQAVGINQKRASDNRYYQSWLDTQMGALQAHSDAARNQLMGFEQQLNGQQQGLYAQQGQQLAQGADQRAGNVSNNSQSNAFGADLSANQSTNVGLLTNAEQQATQGLRTSDQQLTGARANNFAMIQNANSKRIADLNAALTTIANARAKLNTGRVADIAKEIARLQGVEIQKAQSNRDYKAAIQRLGIDQANVNSEIATRKAQVALAKESLGVAMTKAEIAQMNSDRTFKLDVAKYNSTVARDMYERAHGLGPYRPSKGSSTPALSASSQNAIYSHIDRVRAALQEVENFYLQNGYGEAQAQSFAWHAIANGSYTGPGGKVHHSPLREGDAAYINAAYNTMSDRGGLSPGDVAFLKKLGIANPGSRLPVHHGGVGGAVYKGANGGKGF